MRVGIHPAAQSYPCKEFPGFFVYIDLGLLHAAAIGVFREHQLRSKLYVLQRGILGKQVEGLEYQSKVQPLFTYLLLAWDGVGIRVEQRLSVYGYLPLVRAFKEVQTP